MKCPNCLNLIEESKRICPYCEFEIPPVIKKEIPLDKTLVKFHSYSENMAPVATKENLWGYINIQGEIVIAPRFTVAGPFRENLAYALENPQGLYGYIDKLGRYQIQPQYLKAGNFKYNMAPVQKQNGKWQIINKQNKKVIEDEFDEISEIYQNTAIVKENGRLKIINI